MLYKFVRPLLFTIPPERTHNIALAALKFRAAMGAPSSPPSMPITVMGLNFPNPLGLAAGFDKNADAVDAMATLGFGFIEVGAITPEPQSGNSPPRLFRQPALGAIINRMGFNNCGMRQAAVNLSSRRNACIVGVNIGKNMATTLADAVADYEQCLDHLYLHADFFTINISSPNTPGLRTLQAPDLLRTMLATLVAQRDRLSDKHNKRAPLAVKISPDLSDDELSAIADVAIKTGIDGIIACNTTLQYPPEIPANLAGGLSGAPLTARALAVIKHLRQRLPNSVALIGVGGIMNEQDARQRLEAGADLIQIYTGLVYNGPSFPRKILSALRVSSLSSL